MAPDPDTTPDTSDDSLEEWQRLGGKPPKVDDGEVKDDDAHDKLPISEDARQQEIADLEKKFSDSPDGDAETDVSSSEAGFYRDDGASQKTKVKGFSRRKKTVSGLLIGLLVGGGFSAFSALSGPFQLIHIGQLLRQFHQLTSQESGNSRTLQIAKYLYYKDNPEKLRLGRLANKYADRIQGRLSESGFEIGYTQKRGYFDGFLVDPNKIPEGSNLSELKKLPGEEARQALSDHYGIALDRITTTDEGLIKINGKNMGYFENKTFFKNVLTDAGVDGLENAIQQRLISKRAGITAPWHPIQKLKAKIDDYLINKADGAFAAWQKRQQQILDTGNDITTTTAIDKAAQTTDKDGHVITNPDATSAESETSSVLKEAQAAGADITSEGPLATLRTNTSFKLAAGGAAAIGVLCTVKGIADNIDAIKYLSIVKPAMRLGVQAVALGSQIQFGGPGVDMQQIGNFTRTLYDATPGVGDWSNAGSIQYENNEPMTGPGMPAEANLRAQKNLASQIVGIIPGLGTICKGAGSFIGTVVSTTIAFVGGPFSAIAGFVAGPLIIGPALKSLVNMIANHPINVNVAGANLGNLFNLGAKLVSTQNKISAGGVKLTTGQAMEWRRFRDQDIVDQEQQKSFATRLFDPTDAHSLISKVIDKQNPNVGQNVASTLRGITKTAGSLLTLPQALLSGRARAASGETFDYGFDDYGFSMEDLNSPVVSNPFENEQNVAQLLKTPKGNDYLSRAKDCFGVIISADGGVDVVGDVTHFETLPASCVNSDPDWLRLRMYIYDTELMQGRACYEGDSESCQPFQLSMSNSPYTFSLPLHGVGYGLS